MINIVLDTNVLVSAALSPLGIPAQIVSFISNSDEIQVFYSAEILGEYKKVLAYDKLKIPLDTQAIIVETLCEFGIMIAPLASTVSMPDESDRTFCDTAKLVNAYLITGNLKHYSVEDFIVLPADFLQRAGG